MKGEYVKETTLQTSKSMKEESKVLQMLQQREPTLKHPIPKGLYSMGWTHVGAAHQKQQPLGRLMLEMLTESCVPWEGLRVGAGEGC